MEHIKDQINQALTLQNQKKLDDAHALFKAVLIKEPKNADALHGLALNLAIQKHYFEAIPFFLEAIHAAPFVPAFHNNLANTYKALGNLQEARKHYAQGLSLKPNYPEAHNNLGNLLVQLGEIKEAITHFKKAIRINPQAIDAHYNLANCYLRTDRLLEAIPHYEAALAGWPDHVGAHHNLGLCLCALKQFDTAKPHLEYVIEKEPNNVDALFHLAIAYGNLNQSTPAMTLYERVIALKSDHAEAHHNLATLLLRAHLLKDALVHFQAALKWMPQNETAAHMVHALTQDSTSKTAPASFVSALFDQYAFNYDTHVKDHLQYRVPQLLREAMTPFAQNILHPWVGLDLGCGTGQVAPFFNDIVGKLYGVDLSPNMLNIAQQRGGYTKLFTEDILVFLTRTSLIFDIIIAADVFVYIGELDKIFGLIHTHLKSDGFFCFSIEKMKTNENFAIQSSGRFKHSAHYIESLSKGLYTIEYQAAENIREQEGMPVEGMIYVLKKSA